ncbi:sulfatase [Actinomycetota bacterium]
MINNNKKPNIIQIISDTLRTSFLGCYGNKTIKTPNIDKFAKRSNMFTNAYPESIPTIPARRAIHTGRRAFPFKSYEPLKWDVVSLPGWQPLSNDEDTIAENLVVEGYHTGFVTDTIPYFSPGFNFTRGFLQWEFIRGQEMDRWRSINSVPGEKLAKYGDPDEILYKGKDINIIKDIEKQGVPDETLVSIQQYNLILRHAANTMHINSEEEITTAQVFKWAVDFINDNHDSQPFYLFIDCFDPHEPWEAPYDYLQIYADKAYKGRTIIFPEYGNVKNRLSQEEIENIKANYSGLVSLVDKWFGHFIDELIRLDLWEDSIIVFMSDHGTNFTDNPFGIMGKPSYSMFPGLMNIPMMIKLPGEKDQGKEFNELVFNIDATATIYDCLDLENKILDLDGKSLLPLVNGNRKYIPRQYVTSRYSNNLWYRDNKHWIIFDLDKKPYAVFDVNKDPFCSKDIKDSNDGKVIEKGWKALLYDSGGKIPDYRENKETDAVGR